MATTPLKVLFWQQTGCEVQLVPLTPTTEMGVQVMPTGTVKSLRTISRRPSWCEAELELAAWTELQHWSAPVLHWDAGGAVGVATARRGKSARAATLVKNIV